MMISIEDIPAEKRWEIAAKSLIYDMHFRKVLGENMMRSRGLSGLKVERK